MDLVVGHANGALRYFENSGGAVPTFIEQTGDRNPFAGVDVSDVLYSSQTGSAHTQGVFGGSHPIFLDADSDSDKVRACVRQRLVAERRAAASLPRW